MPTRNEKTLFLLVLSISFILLSQYVFPVTIRVPQDVLTVQSAVDKAQTGDTVLVDEGHWRGVEIRKGITLKSVHGRTTTRIGRIVIDLTVTTYKVENGNKITYYQLKNDKTVIEGFTIKGESTPPLPTPLRYSVTNLDMYGGGISIVDSSVSIIDCEISKCKSSLRGGGISTVTRFTTNISDRFIGTVGDSSVTLEVYQCDIVGNTILNNALLGKVQAHNDGGGGGIFIGTHIRSVKIDSCKIISNFSNLAGGAGILIGTSDRKTVHIDNSIFINNLNNMGEGESGSGNAVTLLTGQKWWNSGSGKDVILRNVLVLYSEKYASIFYPDRDRSKPSQLKITNLRKWDGFNSDCVGFKGPSATGWLGGNESGPSYWIFNSLIDTQPPRRKSLPDKSLQIHYIGCEFSQKARAGTGNTWGTGNTKEDLKIEFNDDYTYTINENSPLVDASVSPTGIFLPAGLGKLTFPQTDFFGNPRISGNKPDIGPIEFQFPLPPLLVKEVSVETFIGKSTLFLLESKEDKKLSKFTLMTQPENGKLTDKIDNGKVSLTYTPNTGFIGTDSFKYKVSDGTAESKETQVDITVKSQPVILKFSEIKPVNVDQSFVVQVLLNEITDLAGWSFDLEYDPGILSVESVEEGDALKSEGRTTFFQEGKTNNEEGTVTGLNSVYLGTGGVDTSGNLLTLNLKAVKDGEGYLRFKKVEFGDPKGKMIPIDTTDTTITVSSVPPCDINADGSINIFDLILVAQSFGQETNARVDTNGDGVVSIFDLILVAQCFGQGAAPTIVSQPTAMFSMVENWIHLAKDADDGSEEFDRGITVLKEILSSIKPAETVLMPNYPNPFNPETWIPYHLSQDAEVVIRIYDVRGRIVRTLDMGFQSFGYYASRDKAAYWNGKTDVGEKLSSGTYFYQIQAGGYTETRKLVILK